MYPVAWVSSMLARVHLYVERVQGDPKIQVPRIGGVLNIFWKSLRNESLRIDSRSMKFFFEEKKRARCLNFSLFSVLRSINHKCSGNSNFKYRFDIELFEYIRSIARLLFVQIRARHVSIASRVNSPLLSAPYNWPPFSINNSLTNPRREF